MSKSFKINLKKHESVLKEFEEMSDNLNAIITEMIDILKDEMSRDEKEFECNLSDFFTLFTR